MLSRLERLIRIAYKKWRAATPGESQTHPDEESLACFFENKLGIEEKERIKAHLINCDRCAEILDASVKSEAKAALEENVPEELIRQARNLIKPENGSPVLEAVLRLKEKALEILSATGDVLIGRELVPAPILRSRKVKDFKDEVTILKDFEDIRVEARIENRGGAAFDLTVLAKDKRSQRVIKDLRVTLLKDNLELESYITDLSSVTFENILLGKYVIEISGIEDKIASIILDIKQ